MDTVTRHFYYARKVRRITDRRRGLTRFSALLTAVAAMVVATALVAGIDTLAILSKDLRQILRLAVLGGAALFLALRWRQSRKAGDDREIVRLMENSLPSTGQLLRTGWEIAGQGRSKNQPPASGDNESVPLAEEVVRKSQAITENHNWSHLLPRRAVILALALTSLCLAVTFGLTQRSPDFRLALERVLFPGSAPSYTRPVWISPAGPFDDRHPPRLALAVHGRPAEPLLYFREAGSAAWQSRKLTALPDGQSHDAILTGLMADTEVYAAAGDGVTETLTLRYRPTPRLLDSSVTVTLPDYTGRAAEKRPGGDIIAVEGSRLTWDFTFNTPPVKAEVQITSPTSPPLTLPAKSDGKVISAGWPLPLGKYVCLLNVFDADGASIDSWKYDVGGVPDELPKVEILEPSKDLEATSITELPVRIRARDDFGVAELGLILEAGGQTFHPLEKIFEARDVTDITEMTRAMLEAVPLDVRDNVRIHAYALDHKPRGGPRAVSPLRAIDIRQFKIRTIYAGKAPPSGLKLPASAITQLNNLITAQRVVVSDTHILREPARTESAAAMIPGCQPVSAKESAVIVNADKVRADWEDEPGFPEEDLVLLGTARQQMTETVALLDRGTVVRAFTSGDRALQTLLQMRKHFLKILMESKDPGPPDDPPEMSNPLDFIKEALRLASEEKTVHQQLAPGPNTSGPKAELKVSRRQQEVALSDAGELYAALMAYEKKNEGMLSLMRDAELAMKKADSQIHTEQPLDSVPSLSAAEKHLTDLADFIKAMDESRLADTLNELASKAEQDAKKAGEKSAPPPSPSPSGQTPASPSQSGSSSSSGDESKDTASNDLKDSKPGEKAGSEAGAADGKTKDAEAAAKEAAAAAEAARNAALADSILEALAAQAREAEAQENGGDTDQDPKPPGSGELSREDLKALRDRAGTEALARDLKNLATARGKSGQGPDPGKDGDPSTNPDGTNQTGVPSSNTANASGPQPGNGPGISDNPKLQNPNASQPALSARLSEMAGQFRAEARRLQSSRLARLNEVRAQAKALKEQLEKEKENGKSAEQKALEDRLLAQGIPPGTKIRINGKTIVLGQKSNPGAATDDPFQQQQQGTPGNTPGKEGQQPGENPGPGGKEPGAQTAGGNGDGDGSETAGGGNRSVLGGPATKRFVANAARLNDQPVTTWTKQLETEVPDVAIPALTGIIQRLDTLVAELPADGGEKNMAGRIPESSRREVEDYFKNLSDDLDDE